MWRSRGRLSSASSTSVLVVEPRHRAPAEHIGEESAPVAERGRGAQFEQPVPQLLVVDAAELRGQRVQIAAVREIALFHQASGGVAGIALFRLFVAMPGLVMPGKIDQPQLRAERCALAHGDPFGAVVAEREEGRARFGARLFFRIGVVDRYLARALAQPGDRGPGLFMLQQRQQRIQIVRPLDQHGRGLDLAQQPSQRERTGRAVVPHRHEEHILLAEQPAARGLQRDRKRVTCLYCHSSRAAS